MDESTLFNTARVRINGKCSVVSLRDTQATCGYFTGKPSAGNCKRCDQPWQAHYPARPPKRIGIITEAE